MKTGVFATCYVVTVRLSPYCKRFPAPASPLFLLDPRMLVIDIGPTGRTRCFHMLYNMITVIKLKKKEIRRSTKRFCFTLNTGSGNIVPDRQGSFFYFVINLAPSSRKFYNRNLPREKVNTLYVKPLHSTICCLHLYF